MIHRKKLIKGYRYKYLFKGFPCQDIRERLPFLSEGKHINFVETHREIGKRRPHNKKLDVKSNIWVFGSKKLESKSKFTRNKA